MVGWLADLLVCLFAYIICAYRHVAAIVKLKYITCNNCAQKTKIDTYIQQIHTRIVHTGTINIIINNYQAIEAIENSLIRFNMQQNKLLINILYTIYNKILFNKNFGANIFVAKITYCSRR